MRKKVLLLLVYAVTICYGQKKYENSYLSMDIPTGWEVQNMDVPGMNTEYLYFYNSGSPIYNIGIVMGIEQVQDPAYALQTQIEMRTITIFKNAEFGPIHKSAFMGKVAQSVDFDTTIDGISYKGAAYVFNEGDCTIMSIGCYKVGSKSNLPQIWRSIQWKQHNRDVNKYKNLREELKAFTDAINKMWQETPVISNGEQTVSIQMEDNEDCLVYTYRLIEYSKSQFSEEQLRQIQDNVRPSIISRLKNQASQVELVRRCLNEEYVFKFIYQDKNSDFMFSIKVTPDDYK